MGFCLIQTHGDGTGRVLIFYLIMKTVFQCDSLISESYCVLSVHISAVDVFTIPPEWQEKSFQRAWVAEMYLWDFKAIETINPSLAPWPFLVWPWAINSVTDVLQEQGLNNYTRGVGTRVHHMTEWMLTGWKGINTVCNVNTPLFMIYLLHWKSWSTIPLYTVLKHTQPS